MIAAVIADDLTGAAELASAAADMGFSAEVHTAFDATSSAEIVCLDTDTRLLKAREAAPVVERAAQEILRASPSWIFKKTDSVLRGNVAAEIEALLQVTGLLRARLVPANPSKSRTIRNGVYHIEGTPLHQTAFADDPDHPRTSSNVHELLGPEVIESIALPDVSTAGDVQSLAATTDELTLPAGGVDFFRAVLNTRAASVRAISPPKPGAERSAAPDLAAPILLVCGSLQAWSAGRPRNCESHGIPCLVPDPTLPVASWVERIADALATRSVAMAAIGDRSSGSPAILTRNLARAVAQVLRRRNVSTLCVEGGATSAAVLKALAFTRLAALPSPFQGVAAVRPFHAPSPILLLKPGSYPWPDAFWHSLT
jgi:uncharacterized protein YgbK (DUF1537 family)